VGLVAGKSAWLFVAEKQKAGAGVRSLAGIAIKTGRPG